MPAKESFEQERQSLMSYIHTHLPSDQQIGTIEPWDWRYYAEKVRQNYFDLDDTIIKPYFPLNRMVEAIFDTAHKLFGLEFKERPDIVSYHPDVKTYEVHEKDEKGASRVIAIFLHYSERKIPN